MTEIALSEMASEASETIAYRHRVPWLVDMTYTPHSDRVVVTGSRIWIPKLEAVIWLMTLSLNTSTVWGRSYHFQWAVVFIICVVAVCALMLPGAGPAAPVVIIFGLVLLLIAVAYATWSWDLIRYTHFLTSEGVNTLSIGDAGPDITRYDSFIQEVSRRIQENQPSQN